MPDEPLPPDLGTNSKFTRSCGHSSQPDHERRDRDERQKGCGGFVVARRYAPEVLHFVDEAFDEVALSIELLVVGRRLQAPRERRDHGVGAEGQEGPDSIGVVCLISDDVLGHEPFDQCLGLRAVVDLAGREDETQRVAERIDGDVDFRTRSAA
jgi:hypothetical protein